MLRKRRGGSQAALVFAVGCAGTAGRSRATPSLPRCAAAIAVALLLAQPLSAQELSIRGVTASATRVPQYGRFELALDIAGEWDNPYDPDEIDVQAHFTTPSGATVDVPAFWQQPYESSVLPAEAKRRNVAFLKMFINELEWPDGAKVEFFFDDVALHDPRTGSAVVLGDAEGGVGEWRTGGPLTVSDEMAHTGRRSFRFAPEIDRQENWPGAVLGCGGANWSQFDGLSFWVYPRMARVSAPLRLYFQQDDGTRSPIRNWGEVSGEIRPNEWNRLVWDWSDFAPQIEFTRSGQAGWQLRFAPSEAGVYGGVVTVAAGGRTARSNEFSFECAAGDNPGFVRVSPRDLHYFAYDDGRLFFPIGHDVIWSGRGGPLVEAVEYFPKMQAAGENCTYLIMGALDAFPPLLAIEWSELGRYDQKAAAALDHYLDLAERHGIYLKLSFDVHAHNIRNGRTALWPQNPYSAERGGPCTGPNDFYTNREAIERYKRRLRYIVARWGHRTNIMAWESFAEINGAVELDGRAGWEYSSGSEHPEISAMLAGWLAETSDYLREIDPYDHLISVSFGSDGSDDVLWALPQMDYTQIHHYNSLDTAPRIADWCRTLTQRYAKPMMVTEFGWGVEATDLAVDPRGICNHNGMWASVMSGAAGGAMNWWCARIDRLGLYPQFAALRRFCDEVEWGAEGFVPLEPKLAAPASADNCVDVSLPARGPFDGGTVSEFTVGPGGSLNDRGQVSQFLMAPGRPETRISPVFHVDYPVAGTFGVHVLSVSPDARLDVYLDGELALQKELPAQDVPGKLCVWSEEWKVWRCDYDEEFSVDVPAGRHTIRVENGKPGASWLRVGAYTLGNYDPQPLRAWGLKGRETSVLWVQNKQSTWGNDRRGITPTAVEGGTMALEGFPDGPYDVEWWDTWVGRPTGTVVAEARDGSLELSLPPVERDVACSIQRADARAAHP